MEGFIPEPFPGRGMVCPLRNLRSANQSQENPGCLSFQTFEISPTGRVEAEDQAVGSFS